MEDFCGGPFWDSQLTVNTTNPDFTSCFQSTVLLWLPCFFLAIVSPCYIFYLRRCTRSSIPHTWLNVTKTVLASILAILALVDACKGLQEFSDDDAAAVVFVSPLIFFITMMLALLFIQYGRLKGDRSTGILFIFWLMLVFVNIVRLRSTIMNVQKVGEVRHLFQMVTLIIHFIAVIVQLVLSVFVDKKAKFAEIEDSDPCPEESASFLSRITFWWFTRMVILGFKKPLVREDLWHLNKADASGTVVPHFMKFWRREVCKDKRSNEVSDETPGTDIPLEPIGEGHNTKYKVLPPAGYRASLFKALVFTFAPAFLIAAAFKVMQDILLFVNPQLLKALIGFTLSKSDPVWRGYLLAGMMFINALVQSFILHQYFHGCMVVGMRVRTALVSAIYRKSLALTSSAKKLSTVGEIVNLMSVDAQRFMDLATYLNMLWSAPLQIIVCLYFLWQTLGVSVLAGVGVMILMIPVNAYLANLTKKFQVQQMLHKDSRIKLMNEILNGIKVLKLYAWELSFKEKILGVRQKELDVLKKAAYLNAASTFTWSCAPFLVSLTTFAVYVFSDEKNVLDAEKAFVSLSLFNILRFPLAMLPMVISNLVQAKVSLKRIQRFLKHEELDSENVIKQPIEDNSIVVENGTFTWEDDDSPALQSINLKVPEGSLVAVVGQVGTGKSSLISALLGDMKKVQGTVNVHGSLSYVPQQAWIQNATLRDNILFGGNLNECEYYKALEACALNPDLEMLPAADMTEIGEKGINLSGGQRQRISLARAVYNESDVYFLDDPLSAVDSHVGKHIFDKVIGPSGLLKEKTRILVTHGINFLPQVDMIVVLVDGQISELGSFSQLLNHRGAFAEFLKNYLLDEEEEEDDNLDDAARAVREEIMSHVSSIYDADVKDMRTRKKEEDKSRSSHAVDGAPRETGASSTSINKSWKSLEHIAVTDKIVCGSPASKSHLDEPLEETDITALQRQVSQFDDVCQPPAAILKHRLMSKEEESDKLIQAEKSQVGKVKFTVFVTYMKSVGVLISLTVLFLFTLNNVAQIYSNVWLSEWSNDAAEQGVNDTLDTAKRDMRLGVYGALGFAQVITVFTGALALYLGGIQASSHLHKNLIQAVIRTHVTFFDRNPIGRILNRFSADMETIDRTIPSKFSDWLRCSFQVLDTVIIISVYIPLFLTVFLPLGIIYFFTLRFYVATSRQLKRLESVSRSPIYSHFGETVTGSSVIRAYNQQQRFISESENYVDENQKCYYPNIVSNRWLAIRLEFVGNCIVLFAALFAVVGRDSLSAGIVGLSISYAMNITQTLNWMVRMSSELETNIVAVERVKEYSETPVEADWVIEDNRPEKSWPAVGRVVFNKYSTRYREGLDLVIKNISCDINGGEKIGIVGRTGAGKSSLTLALFRIIEAAEGSITIDGIDIAKIGLYDLRSKLTVIPQDPVLFSGNLRMNLDPFEIFTDDELWAALKQSHLSNFVSTLAEGLDFEVTEGGENLSVGQRQLVCLGRALLRKTKILILDEATAAVDLETDDLIQSTIRTEFAECTVLTIAHRLNTIMDYTRIMVLDAGEIREFSGPQDLLQDKESIFYSMAKDAGLVA